MASSSSSALPSSEPTGYFTCQSELDTESDPLSDLEIEPYTWSLETNYTSFNKLKKDPQWFGYLIESDRLEVGEKIGEGAQAEIYEARMIQPWGARDGAFNLVVKAMKGRVAPNAEWPIRMLAARSKYNQLYDLPLLTILGRTRLDNNTAKDDERLWGRLDNTMVKDEERLWGRFAFVMHRRWGDLRSLIDCRAQTRLSSNGPFSIDQAIYLMLRIAEQMDILHTKHGIIHRDLKSHNVLVWAKSGHEVNVDGDEMIEPIVVDFECNDDVMGTRFWRAPELTQALQDMDRVTTLKFTFKSDVYSYGMVSYEIVSGLIPFSYDTSFRTRDEVLRGQRPELPTDIPLSLRGIIERCWCPNPEERPNFSEICKLLKQIQSFKLATIVNDDKVHDSAIDFKSLIGDNLVIDLSRDLLSVTSDGYVIRTSFPDVHGVSQPCILKRCDVVDQNPPDLAGLQHPHVVHLIGFWIEEKYLFLVMEDLDGDLAELILRTKSASPLSLHVAVDLMLQIAEGMLYLHKMGVLYPLKCDNVLYKLSDRNKEDFRPGDVVVKLGGFGCSRPTKLGSKSQDVLQFGLTCLEILTGDKRSDKGTRSKIPETTPSILKDLIVRCLDMEPTFAEVVLKLLQAKSYILQTYSDDFMVSSQNMEADIVQTKTECDPEEESSIQQIFAVHQLHPQLDDNPTSVLATLIFFHGFRKVPEEWRGTWMTRDNKLVWPQKWLPEDLRAENIRAENIRVLSVAFDENPMASNNCNRHEIGKNLVRSLVLSPGWKLGESREAIFLIGHSFGGVLIKYLVTEARHLVQDNTGQQEAIKCGKFLERLTKIVFYSVPHASTGQEFENYVSKCKKIAPLKRSSFLQSLEGDTHFVADMNKLSTDFESALPEKLQILAFLEGKAMSKESVLVTEKSCEGASNSWEWYKIDKDNHFEVCRPNSTDHTGYRILLDHLRQHLNSGTSTLGADVTRVLGTRQRDDLSKSSGATYQQKEAGSLAGGESVLYKLESGPSKMSFHRQMYDLFLPSKGSLHREMFESFLGKRLQEDASPRTPGSIPDWCWIPGELKYSMIKTLWGDPFKTVLTGQWLGLEVAIARYEGLNAKNDLEAEAGILATVQHPNVVYLFGCAYDNDRKEGYLVTELMELDLMELIMERNRSRAYHQMPFSLSVSKDIILQIVEATIHMQKCRVLHRDLKPSKCLVSAKKRIGQNDEGETYYVVKLTGFGGSKVLGPDESTCIDDFRWGTTAYRAPELRAKRGHCVYSWSTDVYSFGMTMYEILSGRCPFEGYRGAELARRACAGERPLFPDYIPGMWRELIKNCWHSDPEQRYGFERIKEEIMEIKLR